MSEILFMIGDQPVRMSAALIGISALVLMLLIIIAIVLARSSRRGAELAVAQAISADELEQLKVKWRSDYFATLEAGRGSYMPKYGLMHLLACFTLFDNEPQLANTILDGFLAVTREEVQAAARKYLRNEKRAIVFRTPVKASAPSDKKEAA